MAMAPRGMNARLLIDGEISDVTTMLAAESRYDNTPHRRRSGSFSAVVCFAEVIDDPIGSIASLKVPSDWGEMLLEGPVTDCMVSVDDWGRASMKIEAVLSGDPRVHFRVESVPYYKVKPLIRQETSDLLTLLSWSLDNEPLRDRIIEILSGRDEIKEFPHLLQEVLSCEH